jgi:hypothetical protein
MCNIYLFSFVRHTAEGREQLLDLLIQWVSLQIDSKSNYKNASNPSSTIFLQIYTNGQDGFKV